MATAARVQNPIVLVHGLCGYDVLRLGGVTLANYWPGIVATLAKAGNRVHTARLSPTAGIAQRAAQLRDFIRAASPDEPVHVIAHSMGGLDSRYMISRLGMDDRVLSLTTVGTPHRGSPFADWGVRRLKRFVAPLFRMVGLPEQGFYDVTTESCQAFNDQVPDAPTVRYASVAGQISGGWISAQWLLPYSVISRTEGPNDGLVSVTSARWGESADVWEGDHLSLINWFNPQACTFGLWRSRPERYLGLVRRLADAGF
jgi:triacylglycerol lipase